MKQLAKVSAILWIVLAAVSGPAEPIASLRPSNYVNDFAGVLDAATQTRLNDLCRQVEQKAQAQIAVVTVKSTDGQDIVSYAVALYQKWGIGAKGKDRGVLILLATQDRKYWTTVGYGLEPILPDGKVGGFGREAVPLLRNGDYGGAVTLRSGGGDCCPHSRLYCDFHFASDISERRWWRKRHGILAGDAAGIWRIRRRSRWIWWWRVWRFWRRGRRRWVWRVWRWQYGWWRSGRKLVER